MLDVEANRKLCLKQQTELRELLRDSGKFDAGMELFFKQHAMLHSAEMSHTGIWSFEDAVLNDMSEEQVRRIPAGSEHSVAWIIWHLARIEDMTMNLLVAGSSQVLHQENWLERMNVKIQDSGNEIDQDEVYNFSDRIHILGLRDYRFYVGRSTRDIVEKLRPEDLKKKVDPVRLQSIMDQGALVEEAVGIKNYWSRRDIAGLLLMPATRHNLVHLNEALQLKMKSERKSG